MLHLRQSLKKYFGKQKNIDYIMRKTSGVDQTIQIYQLLCMLEKKEDITHIVHHIKNNQLLWNNPTFDKERAKIEEENNFMVCPYELSEGVLTCGRCKSSKIYTFSKQTRSMDEPTTVFAMCSECGHKWCEGS